MNRKDKVILNSIWKLPEWSYGTIVFRYSKNRYLVKAFEDFSDLPLIPNGWFMGWIRCWGNPELATEDKPYSILRVEGLESEK